jgi:hypothetical protein
MGVTSSVHETPTKLLSTKLPVVPTLTTAPVEGTPRLVLRKSCQPDGDILNRESYMTIRETA